MEPRDDAILRISTLENGKTTIMQKYQHGNVKTRAGF